MLTQQQKMEIRLWSLNRLRLFVVLIIAAAVRQRGEMPSMPSDHITIKTIQQLRQFVSHTLCQQSNFEEGIFQVTERILTRGKRTCGIYFCLHGPRSVKLTAVWETDTNSILFYGSTGERFGKTVLATALAI